MLDDDNDVTVLFHRIIRYPCCWRLSKSENVELGFIIYNDICQKNLQFFFHRSSHSFFYLFHLFFLNFFFLLLYLFRYIQSLVFMSSEKSAWNQIMLKIFQQIVLAIFVMSMSVCRARVLSHGAAWLLGRKIWCTLHAFRGGCFSTFYSYLLRYYYIKGEPIDCVVKVKCEK